MWNDGDSDADADQSPAAASPPASERRRPRAGRNRSADPVLPDDPELADDGWGGSRDADAGRDDDLIADRPPHYDR